ncbi:hypothetical protein LP316_08540 [Thalassotalea sp. LPB0316]|uniref:hypothetical protein n=1 Tax=Thalassotalea sp. LPB0316 TaxID=2769490 RepID=UPI0018666727|nr:hypothetical protein [Thalassotalea sp. LPB0316]QOL24416.1 hypothetical protein LP316_08540 [Thalassotalea sp. LPB0316]
MSFNDVNPQEDRLFKSKNRYLIYSIKKRTASNKLVFVFSGVDATPGFCRMSYYSLHEELNENTVHVMDNYGTHGCYLLNVSGDAQIRNVTISLIKELQQELNISLENTYFVGTSKGGTTALLYSLMLGGGNVLAGEPQIKLGEFIYGDRWEDLEQFRALAYAILGRVDVDDKEKLNQLVFEIIERYGPRYKGKIEIIYGSNTGYGPTHIFPFYELSQKVEIDGRIKLFEQEFSDHGEVVQPFLDRLTKIFD